MAGSTVTRVLRALLTVTVAAGVPVPATAAHATCGFTPPASGQAEVANVDVRLPCFAETYGGMVGRGYRPVCIDVLAVAGEPSTTTIWRPADGTPWAFYWQMTKAGFQTNYGSLVSNGSYRLQQFDSYPYAGGVRYAAIFDVVAASPDQSLGLEMTAAEYQSQLDLYANYDWRPVGQSVALSGSTPRYSVLYEKVPVGAYTAYTSTAAADSSSCSRTRTTRAAASRTWTCAPPRRGRSSRRSVTAPRPAATPRRTA